MEGIEYEVYLWEDFLASYYPWEHDMIRVWDLYFIGIIGTKCCLIKN